MANLLQTSAPILGLLGRTGGNLNRLGLLLGGGMMPPAADEGDEAFLRRYQQQGFEGQPWSAPAKVPAATATAPVAPVPQAMPERRPVSGWRVLDRVLGGQTITEGVDSERERNRIEALRPVLEAQRQQTLSAITDPRERALFLTSPEDWAKNVGQQYAPQVLAAGAGQAIGGRVVAEQPRTVEQGDTFYRVDSRGVTPTYTRTEPSIAERTAQYVAETGRINASNPVNVAQNGLLVDPRTGQTIAAGVQRPDLTSVAPGGQIYATDAAGRTALVGESTAQRPMSDADQRAIQEAEGNIARINTAVGRAQTIKRQLDSGELNLGPVANVAAGIRNATGNSNQNSLNYDSLLNWARTAREAILQSANGVQTEGDALRALDLILSNPNDERVVRQALDRYIEAQTPIRTVFERDIARRSGNSGAPASAPAASQITPEQARAILRARGVQGY